MEDYFKIPCGAMILPDKEYYSLNSEQTHLNNNVLICGTSGTQKTRLVVIPNMLECVGSNIIADAKCNLYNKYGDYLKYKGINVNKISFKYPKTSLHYNPLFYLHNTQDIQGLTYNFVYSKPSTSSDPFWDEMATYIINSAISYVKETESEHPECCNIPFVIELLRESFKINENSSFENCKYATLMEIHEEEHPDSWAVRQYKNMSGNPFKTYNTIVSNALGKFSMFDTEELSEMLSNNDIDFKDIGIKKSVIFCEFSDTDRTFQPLINIFFNQAIHELCNFADKCKDSRLPCPVRFIFDDFASIHIKDFDVIIANIRSRMISAMILIQSISQLNQAYKENATTIIDCCDTFIFMGTNSPDTARYVSLKTGKSIDSIMSLKVNTSIIYRRGDKPKFCENYDLNKYIEERHHRLNYMLKNKK